MTLLLLDKSANIVREKAAVEQYGGRVYFTGGETFSSTKLAHFHLSAPEAAQENPLLRNERVLFRDLSDRDTAFEQKRGRVAADGVSPPARIDWRAVGRRVVALVL